MNEIFFDHEKLIVYQKALYFIEWLESLQCFINKKIDAIDHLDRASSSIVFNIAEGNGKFSGKDKCRFFDIARGSSLECAGCLDVMLRKKLILIDDNRFGKEILREIVSMLIGLIKANSDRIYDSNGNYDSLQS